MFAQLMIKTGYALTLNPNKEAFSVILCSLFSCFQNFCILSFHLCSTSLFYSLEC
ncbi:hypothetical protein Scep_016908 [Stephania cephalantha]|uniref:Uncharacterized protein n=1 Tax=Stephania cephalantha TaxID=152367 RepID=A0AAP0IPH2_9MAGN